MSDRSGVGLVFDLDHCSPDSTIPSWDDLGDVANWPKGSWQLGVHYHNYGSRLKLGLGQISVPLRACLQSGKIVSNETPPKWRSQNLSTSPAEAAQHLSLSIYSLWK